MSAVSNPSRLNELLSRSLKSLDIRQLSEGITCFGGSPLRVQINGREIDYWSQFIRVRVGENSMVFRAISRLDEKEIRSLGRRIVIDSRSNLEREIEPHTKESELSQSQNLLLAYLKLFKGEIDLILMPTREGSLGPTKEFADFSPFADSGEKYKTNPWDITEEILLARVICGKDIDKYRTLLQLRNEIMENYQQFALPLIKFLAGELLTFNFGDIPEIDLKEHLSFFNDTIHVWEVDVGGSIKTVEQLIAYPYPTEKGVIFVRLIRVWNAAKTKYEVVRVLQTKPTLESIAGLRIDSNCVDGVHALDAHCDCRLQLEAALYECGLEKEENIIVLQMQDHEGKSWGAVLKGAIHRLVRFFNTDLSEDEWMAHLEADNHFYQSLGLTPDNRSYGSAQLVLTVLGIKHVDNLMMGNQEKISSVVTAGISYNSTNPVMVDPTRISKEARAVLKRKKKGEAKGRNGTVRYE